MRQRAYQVAIVWQFVAAITQFFRRVLEFIWNNQDQKSALQDLSLRVKRPENTLIETLYFTDLKKQLGRLEMGSNPTVLLNSIDETAKQLEELVSRAEETAGVIKQGLQGGAQIDDLLPEADALYRGCMEELKRLKGLPGTDVQRALYSGRLTTIFRELDDAFSDRKGEMLHRYCGCHIEGEHSLSELKEIAPTLSSNFERKNYKKYAVKQPEAHVRPGMPNHPSAALLSQSFGGGHNVVQHAMSQRLAEQNGHAYKIEADEEVLEPHYQFKRWTGKSGTEWSQLFLQGNYFRTIRFVGWLSSSQKRDASTEGLVHRFALSLLSRGRQDLATMLFTRHAKGAEEAANHLGMGFADIATDLDYEVFGFSEGAKNPHYRHVLMAKDPILESQGVGKVLQPHQIVEGGFPVREPFLRKYSGEELMAIRAKYKNAYGLADDARVVVLLCGGEGVENQFAETLAKHYAGQDHAPKIHLFAVCGNNEKKRKKLEILFASVDNEKIRASAIGFASDTQLGELFAMATFEKDQGLLISAKAGGGTVSEAIARGVPFLACDMTKVIKHERMNLEFLTQRNLGSVFSRASELPAKVVAMLKEPLVPVKAPDGTHYSDWDSKEKSMAILSDLVAECRADEGFQEKQRRTFGLVGLA